jgi:hypothetical protein
MGGTRDDWDDLESQGLELSRGGPNAEAHGPSAYAGGTIGELGDDDPFAEDAPNAAIELDAPARHPSASHTKVSPAPAPEAEPPQATMPQVAAPQMAPEEPAPPIAAALPRRDPAALIARYPDPPSRIWETPVYAVKVLWRQFELRQDLTALRRRRSPDVPLYERALTLHDAKTFTVGLVLTCTALFLASVLFFMPVILRFIRSPD